MTGSSLSLTVCQPRASSPPALPPGTPQQPCHPRPLKGSQGQEAADAGPTHWASHSRSVSPPANLRNWRWSEAELGLGSSMKLLWVLGMQKEEWTADGMGFEQQAPPARLPVPVQPALLDTGCQVLVLTVLRGSLSSFKIDKLWYLERKINNWCVIPKDKTLAWLKKKHLKSLGENCLLPTASAIFKSLIPFNKV